MNERGFATKHGGLTTALTWVPEPALFEFARFVGAEASSAAGALVTTARAVNADIVWVPARAAWALEAIELLVAEGRRPAWAVDGVLSRVANEKGWGATIRRSASAPEGLVSTLDRALHDVLDATRSGEEAGCDLLVVADDLAGPAGWLVSPDFALDLLVPSYRVAAHSWRGSAVFHSDGDVRALMPALAAAGFAGVHLASIHADDISAAAYSAWSAGLAVLGGVPATALDDDTATEAAVGAAKLSAMGALVVADDGGITVAPQLGRLQRALAAAREALRDQSQ
ncbi:MAG TPA: hypothetical protein VFG89_09815 [Coriobacteriia bacterium]|nr:hypothetical protein [Coriobacteriia bacterium]